MVVMNDATQTLVMAATPLTSLIHSKLCDMPKPKHYRHGLMVFVHETRYEH